MRKILSWALGLVLTAGAATATPVTYSLLDFIESQGTVQSGDKTFSNFAAVVTKQGTGVILPIDLSGINVTPIQTGGLFGLQLAGTMYVACVSATCPTAWDLNVSWDVTAGPGYLIDGVYLGFNGASSGPPQSRLSRRL